MKPGRPKRGRGRWERLPAGLLAEELVPLQVWAKEHGVPTADLIDLAGEGLLPLGKRGGQFFLDAKMAGVVWAEHGQRMLAKRFALPPRVGG